MMSLPVMVRINMNIVIANAAAQACACQLSYGPMAYWNMVTVNDAIGWFILSEKKELLNEVNSKGAVSPATRAIESNIPVSIPVAAPR